MLLVRIVALLLLTCFGVAHGFVLRMAEGFSDGAMSRREAVSAIASSAALAGTIIFITLCRLVLVQYLNPVSQ